MWLGKTFIRCTSWKSLQATRHHDAWITLLKSPQGWENGKADWNQKKKMSFRKKNHRPHDALTGYMYGHEKNQPATVCDRYITAMDNYCKVKTHYFPGNAVACKKHLQASKSEMAAKETKRASCIPWGRLLPHACRPSVGDPRDRRQTQKNVHWNVRHNEGNEQKRGRGKERQEIKENNINTQVARDEMALPGGWKIWWQKEWRLLRKQGPWKEDYSEQTINIRERIISFQTC